MYPVSDEYLEMIQSRSFATNWYGTVKSRIGMTYPFNTHTMVSGSGKITREICSGNDIEIGSTCAAELDISLYLENVSRYELYGGSIELNFQLQLADGTMETVPIGTFYITEPPERTRDIITIHAYDGMQKFNADFNTLLTGKPYDMLLYACNACSVELGMTEQEVTALTNGAIDTYTYSELDIFTYRDLVSFIATYLCCYAVMGPDNKLYLRQYGMEPVRVISEDWRYEYRPMDYEAFYTALDAYFAITEETETVVLAQGGLTYDIGTNPLIQFNAYELRRAVLEGIIGQLSIISYTPFTASTPCDPALTVGDAIAFVGNHAVEGKVSAITKQVITIGGGMDLTCAGSDPNLADMTVFEKRVQAIAKDKNKDGMYYYDYSNTARVIVRDGHRQQIILFNYMTTKRTHVDFHAELTCSIDTTEIYSEESDDYTENDGIIKVIYLLGGNEVTSYYPVDSFVDGEQLKHLVYMWWASGNITSTFEVFLEAVGCTLTIDVGGIKAYIAGVGLIGDTDAWDGNVNIKEKFKPIDFSIIRKTFTDDVEVAFPQEDESGVVQKKAWTNFFSIFKQFTDELVQKGLHRFSVVYDDYHAEKVNVVTSETVWKNEDETVDGTITTPNYSVERVLQVTSARNPNAGDVTYLVSFNSGETWYTYADGFIVYRGSGYGMVAGTMASIPETAWFDMVADRGTIMVRAILQADATLTDIQVYIYETNRWTSIEADQAESYDSRYVQTDEGKAELITKGYSYTSQRVTVDSGYMEAVTIDTTVFSNIIGVEVSYE